VKYLFKNVFFLFFLHSSVSLPANVPLGKVMKYNAKVRKNKRKKRLKMIVIRAPVMILITNYLIVPLMRDIENDQGWLKNFDLKMLARNSMNVIMHAVSLFLVKEIYDFIFHKNKTLEITDPTSGEISKFPCSGDITEEEFDACVAKLGKCHSEPKQTEIFSN
jgi:hypothetical protein